MYFLVEMFRAVYYGRLPTMEEFLPALFFSVGILVFG
jgi:ABC-type polysaccharide/polyol phosphate export permease